MQPRHRTPDTAQPGAGITPKDAAPEQRGSTARRTRGAERLQGFPAEQARKCWKSSISRSIKGRNTPPAKTASTTTARHGSTTTPHHDHPAAPAPAEAEATRTRIVSVPVYLFFTLGTVCVFPL
tara:strand:- start:388 stop:759 length:372 start_codon:yes stop_codon:yes gene_type:complete